MCFVINLFLVCLCFGCRGKGREELNNLCDIIVVSNGIIVVVDILNDRIQLFISCGGFLWQFGCFGKDVGKFNFLIGVCIL